MALVCVELCVRLVSVAAMPRKTLVWVDRECISEHPAIYVDASLCTRGALTSNGAQAVNEALAQIDPGLSLSTARTCAAHAMSV